MKSLKRFTTILSVGYNNGSDYKIVIITEPKTIYFDLSKKVDQNLKHKICFII